MKTGWCELQTREDATLESCKWASYEFKLLENMDTWPKSSLGRAGRETYVKKHRHVDPNMCGLKRSLGGEKQKQTRLVRVPFEAFSCRALPYFPFHSFYVEDVYDTNSKLEKMRRSSLDSEWATNSSLLTTWTRDQKHAVSGQNRRITTKLYVRSGLGRLYLRFLNRSSKNPEEQIQSASAAKRRNVVTINIHISHCHIEKCVA